MYNPHSLWNLSFEEEKMKRLLALFAVLILGYFVSIGCVYKGSSKPLKTVDNKILAINETNSSVILMGDRYFMEDTGGDLEIFKHLIDLMGVKFIIRDGESIGVVEKGDKFDFILDVVVDPHLLDDDFLQWVKTVERDYEFTNSDGSSSTRKESVFHENRDGTYSAYVRFKGNLYKSNEDILRVAQKISSPFTLKFTDQGVKKLRDFDKTPQKYILIFGVDIRKMPTAQKIGSK